MGNALALAAGIGALSFFGVWMERYQIYFILASLAVMTLAVVWMQRRYDFRSARRMAHPKLTALAKELDKTHPGAAASLREGLQETLTVPRLGVPPTLAPRRRLGR